MQVVGRIDMMLWRSLGVVVFLLSFPLLIAGAWGVEFSRWCGERAAAAAADR